MKIPEYIIIKGKVWQIKQVDAHEIYNNLGMCFYSEKVIKISKENKKDEIRSTILHELVHAILYSYGFLQTDFGSNIHELLAENFGEELNDIFKTITFKDPIFVKNPKKRGKK